MLQPFLYTFPTALLLQLLKLASFPLHFQSHYSLAQLGCSYIQGVVIKKKNDNNIMCKRGILYIAYGILSLVLQSHSLVYI